MLLCCLWINKGFFDNCSLKYCAGNPYQEPGLCSCGERQQESRGDLKTSSCGSQGRKEKGEKFNISRVSNGWRHGIGKELKEKGTLCEVEEEGTAKSSGLLEIKVGH